jgi:hypothetical protein
MPNLGPGINQQNSNRNVGNKEQQQEKEEFTTSNKFENHLLSIRDEHQRMIYPNCHPTYNERHQKIIEMIDWSLEKYKMNMEKHQQHNEQIIIDNIIKELAKKRDIAIYKKKQALFKDDVSMYRLEEDTIDYVLFRIRECTGKLV